MHTREDAKWKGKRHHTENDNINTCAKHGGQSIESQRSGFGMGIKAP